MNSLVQPARADASDPIRALLDGSYLDAETGKLIGVETRSLVVADTLAGTEAELVGALGFGKRLAVVSDSTTHAVLGQRVETALAGRFDVQSIVLYSPYPDDTTVSQIRAATSSADAFIAVGS